MQRVREKGMVLGNAVINGEQGRLKMRCWEVDTLCWEGRNNFGECDDLLGGN